MHPKLEELIYNLLPGEITRPVRLQEGWYIAKVYSVTEKPFLDEKEKREVEKIVARRIEENLYQDFYKKFFKGINVTADRALFSELAASIQKYLSENEAEFREKRDNTYRLVEKDFYRMRESIPAGELSAVFIKFALNPITLSQFIDHIMLESLELESADEQHIRTKLNSYIRRFIQNELIAREAITRGYEKLYDVDAELKSWSDFYLSRLMMKKIFSQKPVSDDEAYSFFEKSRGMVAHPDQVKIAEILVGDLESVEAILNELDKGKEFKELAEKYTLRDSLRSRGGEFGYFPVDQNGELGKNAEQMKIGDILGPIKTNEGYSIIKLLGRKEGEKIHYEKFEDAKEEIKNYLRTDKMYKQLDEITAKLAADNGIEINEKALRSIKVTDINMIVFRRFGFGGQLIAAPYSPDFSSWFRVFEQMKKKLSL